MKRRKKREDTYKKGSKGKRIPKKIHEEEKRKKVKKRVKKQLGKGIMLNKEERKCKK